MENKELELLRKLEKIVDKLPFGESKALPWCRESFPELDKVMKELEKLKGDPYGKM